MIKVNRTMTEGKQLAWMMVNFLLTLGFLALWIGVDKSLAGVTGGLAIWMGWAGRGMFWRSGFEPWVGRTAEIFRIIRRATALLVSVALVVVSAIALPAWGAAYMIPFGLLIGFTGRIGWDEGLPAEEWGRRKWAAFVRSRTPDKYKGLG